MTTTVLITRPADQGAAFAKRIENVIPQDVRIMLSPVVNVVATDTAVSLNTVSGVIFTSVNGVRLAAITGAAKGLRAWCVGDKTAAAARDMGFDAVSADGTAQDLKALILSHRVVGPLVHLRGQDARGDIAQELSAGGVPCSDIITYRQEPVALDAQGRAVLMQDAPVIAPVFSPKSGEALLKQGPFTAPIAAVAMSDAVADVLRARSDWPLTVAARPTVDAMVSALSKALGGNWS